MADVSRGTDQSNTERSLTKKGLSFEQSIRLASTASQEMGTAQPGQEARSSTSETDPRVAFREAFTSLQDIHNILPKDLLGNQGKYEACKRAFGRFMDAFDHSDQTARSKYADDLCKQIEDLINVLNTMEQKIDTMEQKIGESANIRAFTQGKLQKLDEIVTQSKGSSIHKHRSDQHKRAQSFCSDIDASKSILDKKGGLENLLMVVQRSCFQLYDTREQFQDYLQTLAHLQQNVAKIEDYLTQKDGALWPPFQAQTSQMHGSEETTTRLKKSDIREQLRSYDRPDVVFEERKATKYDRAKRSLRDKDTRIEYLRQDDEHMKQLYRDLLKEERQARADLWQRRTTLEFYLMEKALVSQHQFQAQPPQIHGTGELIISFFNQFTPEAKAAYQWASNNKNLQNPRLPIQVLRDADQCLMRSHTDVLGKELETRYPGFKDLWSTHREGLLFLFPDKADPLVDQIVQNNLEPTQRVHHPRWEKQKQRLGRTDELLRAIETVRPLLENFHQLYRYLSSENPDHILSNLDKLSQDSGWMAKLQDAFDPQHFSGFWERLQHIYGNLRALESSNRDYQKPNDDSEWLMKKLEECKQRETQLRESIGSVKDLIYRNRRKVRNYLKRQDAFPEEFIRDLRSEEAKCRERQNDPAIRGNVQVPLADLQKRYNDLDAASKVLDRTLETYEERWLHGAREILREIDHTLKQCRGYVQLEDEGILPQESEMGGVILIDLDLMCHYWVNRYRTALEEACIECHGFIEEETTVQDLLESVGRRFEEISPTEQRDSPISPQTHLDKLEGANQHLMTMLRVWQRSALGQMKIPEDDIANAQESLTKAKEYQPEHPDTIMAKEFMDCLEEMEKSVQAASKYSKYSGQDLVSIVNNPERPNDITELCWALKIKASREKLEKALEMTQTSERDSLSKEHERDSKTPHLEVARKKLKELEAIHIKLEKIWENHETQIKQDSSPEALDNFYTQLGTSYEKVDGQQMWLETCDDLVKVEQEKKQLTETLEAWRNKYKWQPNLEKLHTTYEQVLQYFAKGPSHTPDQILGYVEDFSQISLIGKVIQKKSVGATEPS